MLDPITIQILRSRFAAVADEMHHHLYRSGYSTIVRESHDFSCTIIAADGRILVPPRMFLHAPVYYHLIRGLLEHYGAEGLEDGDVLVSNHPYEAGMPHVPDMAVVAPIFFEGRLIAFAGTIAHKADLGGTVPGSTYGRATEIFQEGLILPAVKLVNAGKPNLDLQRIIAANSRQPGLVLGDLGSQVGVTGMGRRRVVELCEQYGYDAVADALTAINEASAAKLRMALKALPNGVHEASAQMDGDGVTPDSPVRLHARVTVEGGAIEFDLTQSDDQRAGPVNLRPAQVEACCYYTLISLLDPELQYTDAARDLVTIRCRPGSVVDSRSPASVSSYMPTCQRLVDVLLEALGPFKSSRAIAHSGGTGGAMTIAWQGSTAGKRRHQYEIFGSAYGGLNGQDGTSGCVVHLSSTLITPVEIIETEFPCRVRRFELVPGSGGAGQFRGGLGIRREYELLEPALVIYRADRSTHAPRGVAGGTDGAPSRFVVEPGTPQEKIHPASLRLDLSAGAIFRVESAAGGGFGSPSRRDPTAVASDQREGYVAR